jgi:hypothetical protein
MPTDLQIAEIYFESLKTYHTRLIEVRNKLRSLQNPSSAVLLEHSLSSMTLVRDCEQFVLGHHPDQLLPLNRWHFALTQCILVSINKLIPEIKADLTAFLQATPLFIALHN